MRILSIEFRKNWSWGLVFNHIQKCSDNEIMRVFMDDKDRIPENNCDIILSQNVTLLKKFISRLKTICRLGGNYNFEGVEGNLQPLLTEMGRCFALIATNTKLYELAKEVNPNTYLIPNGLDLDEWKPNQYKVIRPFTVGFCANITTPFYREYKGYDMVNSACHNLGYVLKTALYKNKQTPHERMQKDFYYKIDCLIHPTKGEGSSNSIMEACACGVPIITTREAGFHGERFVDCENALICTRELSSIISCLMRLRAEPELRIKLGMNARKFAEEHHDVRKIAEQYDAIFTDCYDKNRSGKYVR